MTQAEVKKIFRAYLPTKRAYEVAERSVKRARTDLEGLRAIIDAEDVDGETGKALTEATEKYEACIENLAKKLFAYAEVMERTEKLLDLASKDGATIIRLRWFEDVKFDFIPGMIYCDISTMYRRYQKALRDISEKSNSLKSCE